MNVDVFVIPWDEIVFFDNLMGMYGILMEKGSWMPRVVHVSAVCGIEGLTGVFQLTVGCIFKYRFSRY